MPRSVFGPERFLSGFPRFGQCGFQTVDFRVQSPAFGAPAFGDRFQFRFQQRPLPLGFAQLRFELALDFFHSLFSRTVLLHLPKYNKAA